MAFDKPTMESAIVKQVLGVFEEYPDSWLDHWTVRVNCGGQTTVSRTLTYLTEEGILERNKPAPADPKKTQRGVKWRLKR